MKIYSQKVWIGFLTKLFEQEFLTAGHAFFGEPGAKLLAIVQQLKVFLQKKKTKLLAFSKPRLKQLKNNKLNKKIPSLRGLHSLHGLQSAVCVLTWPILSCSHYNIIHTWYIRKNPPLWKYSPHCGGLVCEHPFMGWVGGMRSQLDC